MCAQNSVGHMEIQYYCYFCGAEDHTQGLVHGRQALNYGATSPTQCHLIQGISASSDGSLWGGAVLEPCPPWLLRDGFVDRDR
jgi:hypothetical protein